MTYIDAADAHLSTLKTAPKDGCVAPTVRPALAKSVHFVLFYADIVSAAVLGYAFLFIYQETVSAYELFRYSSVIALYSAFFAVYAFGSRFYDWRQLRHSGARPLVAFRGALFAFGCLLLIGFVFKETATFSRLWGGSWVAGVLAYILISRAALTLYLARAARQGQCARRAVIVGAGDVGRDVLKHLQRFDRGAFQVVGFLDDRADRNPTSIKGVPVLGGTALAERLVQEGGVDLVIMALPWSAHGRIKHLVTSLAMWPADIYMAPDHLGLHYADRPVFRMAGMNMLSLKDRPISEWSAVVKRIEDLAIAVPALLALSPLFALVALAITVESKGPVFFRQERFGFNNNLIRVWKFRSMFTHMTDAAASQLTTKDDPRVTKVGKFIRKTNIDELPQLINVVQGSMSIVGPRPHATQAKAADELYFNVVSDYASRHRVKPGITGWAQCNGWRGDTDTREKLIKRVEHDLFYVENWSIFLDAVIIFKTAFQMLRGDKNAY